jgi:hypothetical protein
MNLKEVELYTIEKLNFRYLLPDIILLVFIQ